MNCSSKDQKTYETKLVNPLAARLQAKNIPELVTIYHILENQNNIVLHSQGLNSERIDQKQQNAFDSFVALSSKVSCLVFKNFTSDDLIETLGLSLNERASQMEKSAIITLDDTLIMNEQESLDYYLKNKNSNAATLDFHLEIEEPATASSGKESALSIRGTFLLKALVHKKAIISDARKVQKALEINDLWFLDLNRRF